MHRTACHVISLVSLVGTSPTHQTLGRRTISGVACALLAALLQACAVGDMRRFYTSCNSVRVHLLQGS